MRLPALLKLRLRSLFRRNHVEQELNKELAYHLEEQVAEFVSQGMNRTEALAAAHRLFGTVSSIEEGCRDQRRVSWIEDFLNDARFALRSFGKSPGFTFIAVLTLALGLGANTAVLSTAYSVLFRPLPYPHPDRLIVADGGVAGVGPVTALRTVSTQADYAGYLPNHDATLMNGGEAVRVRAAIVTSNLLAVLGVHPARGRWFDSSEEHFGRHRVAVLSHRMWRDRFGADPYISGRQLSLNNENYEIVGVMGPEFTYPKPDTELWIPIRINPANIGYMWGGSNLFPIGRLRAGATVDTAQQDLRAAINRIRPMFPWRMPDSWAGSASVSAYSESLTKSVRAKLLTLSVASILLLLIACVNVANLLLARAVNREREFAMREALGARWSRLLRQLCTENLLLAIAGGLGGLLIATLILRSLPWILPKGTPRLHEVTLDETFVAFTAAAVLATMALFGIAPMIRILRSRREATIGKATASKRATAWSMALIGGELAVATMLLVGAGLMMRTLAQLAAVDTGLRTEGIVTARVAVGPQRCGTAQRCLSMVNQLNHEFLSSGSVRSVNWSNYAPLDTEQSAVSSDIEDHPVQPGAPAYALWHLAATPGYFEALGIRLLAGRPFTDADRIGAPSVVIISESTAKKFWPKGDAIGKRIRPVWQKEWRTIVGVAGDVTHSSLKGFPSWVDGVHYSPLAQVMPQVTQSIQMTVFLNTHDPQFLEAALPRLIRERYPDLAVTHIRSLEAIRSESIADERSTTLLLLLFATLGLTLGIIGVHGAVSHRAAQRTREIGIRMALGATRSTVMRMVLSETAVVAAVGCTIGIAAAFALTRYLKTLLFGITAHDPLTFAAAPLALLAAAIVGAALPGLRAARIDPAITLRAE